MKTGHRKNGISEANGAVFVSWQVTKSRPSGYTPGRDSVRRQDTISTSIDPESPELCRDDLGKSRRGVYPYSLIQEIFMPAELTN